MPPRSTRAAPAKEAAPESAPKRRASARVAGASNAALKKQKYDSSAPDKPVQSTTKKSKYFQEDGAKKPRRNAKRTTKPKDDYEDEGSGDSSDADSDFWQPEQSSTAGKEAISQAVKDFENKRGAKSDAPGSSKKRDLWREGVKVGLGPGKEVFIEKPKARDPGDVPYKDNTLHPNTILFLKDLTKNNERQWLKAHDADYRSSKKDWDTFVETLTEKVTEKDSTIPELPAKDLVFRIYRDIRFSKDPTPYKTHFSAAWSRTGKKGPYAAYYVHVQPGASFVGSGLWHPEADRLALLRDDIDGNSQGLKRVLREEGMRREFFDGISDDEDKAVKAFVSQNSESALKTKPKGYEHDNENIQLLRLRSFTIGKRLPDADLLSPDAQEKITALIGIMEPFVSRPFSS
ncbi:hypothetical protein ASPSYDRAFT_92193 [Aspergillus sydowii CBS 593.65]|uniref:TIGR02453 family protein n=1 Tax=Aspergillus sydowii CBS 593.65 TaxID=1036612 RepID=A0A1L9T995_9EURO|nr:uncharacterized protein ASPSYDRAFT_92193 [Aspergillus sydowii CBS 593.65]OJJ55994.1 hypothetical protein ASPSYDRAFT_92193 [Aspergillus sydowii CBS 593.65]